MRYELADYEWGAIKPFLPNKPRGVDRVNDRRVSEHFGATSGQLWSLHDMLQPLRALAAGGRLGWDNERVLAATHDPAVQMIDTSIIRMHQQRGLHRAE
jgi:hypothetical protein